MPLLSLTQSESFNLVPMIESYCFFSILFAPTIAMEILSKGNIRVYINDFFYPFSMQGIFSLWKDCNGKRGPKGGAQFFLNESFLFFPMVFSLIHSIGNEPR